MSKYKEKDAIEDRFTKSLCSILNLDKTIFKNKHNEVCVSDEQYLYVQNLIKNIDPDTEALRNDKTKESYIAFLRAKLMAMAEQQGIDPSILQPIKEEEKI